MRRPLDSKPNTNTESMDIDAAGISLKVNAHDRGYLSIRLRATDGVQRRDGLAEVSRGHSRSIDGIDGPNMWCGKETELWMRTGDADRRAGMPGAFGERTSIRERKGQDKVGELESRRLIS